MHPVQCTHDPAEGQTAGSRPHPSVTLNRGRALARAPAMGLALVCSLQRGAPTSTLGLARGQPELPPRSAWCIAALLPGLHGALGAGVSSLTHEQASACPHGGLRRSATRAVWPRGHVHEEKGEGRQAEPPAGWAEIWGAWTTRHSAPLHFPFFEFSKFKQKTT